MLISTVSGLTIHDGDAKSYVQNTDMMEIKKELLKLSENVGKMEADMKVMKEKIVSQNTILDKVVANVTQFEGKTVKDIKDMKEHMVSNATDCLNSEFTYYPLGTTAHKLCKEYPSLKLKFIGYGTSTYGTYIEEYKLTFWQCVEKCSMQRIESGSTWNGMTWGWGSGKCVCKTYDGANKASTDYVHYRFYGSLG